MTHTVYGLTLHERKLLEKWCKITGVKEQHFIAQETDCVHVEGLPHVSNMRCVWLVSGGRLPVTEDQTVFLKPEVRFI